MGFRGGTSTLQNPLHQYTGVGQYDIQLIVIDSTGCSIVDTAYASVTIVEPETFDANWNLLPPPPCSNEVLLDATFTGSGADSLVWLSNGIVLSNQVQVTQLFDVAATYTVSLIAYDFDCSEIDTLTEIFTVSENSDYGKIEMPNVFTPNKGQTNDVYKPKYASNNYEDVFDNLELYDILITNRWGHEIFHSGQTQSEWSWDGMIKGEPATEGIYFYIVMYQPFCTELEEGENPLIKQHGFIHLISE
ncbi:gliding motility-associated C-terminal domain-containing protein [bacterium]|nr:gliding motility-associated C-terminal domain-containing protein [bacterium]